VQNSPYVSTIVFWISRNPRLTAGKIRARLIKRFGSEAKFSEPTIRAWMTNYMPEIIHTAADEAAESGDRVVPSLTESELFGTIHDALEYHSAMLRMLERAQQGVDRDLTEVRGKLEALRADADKADPLVLVALSTQQIKLHHALLRGTKEIRETRRYIEEYQRAHDFGERMGDLLGALVEACYDTIFPDVMPERLQEVTAAFDARWKEIGREFGVPAQKS